MGWSALPLPVVWAQATGAGTAPTTVTPSLGPLALRRWCGSLTLSSPSSLADLHGLWVWLAGLGALLVLAVCFQGPGKALRQLFEVPGHVRVAVAAVARLRRAGRLLAAVIGLTVVSWTGSQSLTYNQSQGRDDLAMLSRSRGVGELSLEQGVLAALTPLRDVAGLGSNLPLLTFLVVLLFRATSEVWAGGPGIGNDGTFRPRPPGWASAGWACGSLYVLYRLVAIPTGFTDLPLGGCLMIEAVVVPAVMLVCDGIVLAWVLAELRDAGFGDPNPSPLVLSAPESASLMPGAGLACLFALPARYVTTAVFLASYYLPSSMNTTAVAGWLRWLLGDGIAALQGVALLGAGLAGAVAWTHGSMAGALRIYGRMLREHGARLVVLFATAGVAAGAASAAAYFAVLALPPSTWLLSAADSYAHYLSLPVGLAALAALVELAEASLPVATLAAVTDPEAVEEPAADPFAVPAEPAP